MLSLTCTYCLWDFIYGVPDSNRTVTLLLIIFSTSLHALYNVKDLVLALLVQSNTVRSKMSYAVRFLATSSTVYEVKMVAFLMSSCHILG